jgi:hypothetical protein
VWVKVVDTEGNLVGDVDRIKPAPDDVVDLRDAVLKKMSKQLGYCDANQLKVFAAGADPTKDKPLPPPAGVPSDTTYEAPLIVLVPGKNHRFCSLFSFLCCCSISFVCPACSCSQAEVKMDGESDEKGKKT